MTSTVIMPPAATKIFHQLWSFALLIKWGKKLWNFFLLNKTKLFAKLTGFLCREAQIDLNLHWLCILFIQIKLGELRKYVVEILMKLYVNELDNVNWNLIKFVHLCLHHDRSIRNDRYWILVNKNIRNK